MGALRSLWTLVVLVAFALGSAGCTVAEIEVESDAEDREEHLLHRRQGKVQTVRVRPRRDHDEQAAGASASEVPVALGPLAGELTGAVVARLAPYHPHAPERIEFELHLSMCCRGPPSSSAS